MEGYGFVDGTPIPGVWMTYKTFIYYDNVDKVTVPRLAKALDEAFSARYASDSKYAKLKKDTILYTVGAALISSTITAIALMRGR